MRDSAAPAKRSGISTHEAILVALLMGLFFMVAFRFRPGRDRSPFSFFGVAPGMSLGQLRDIADKQHGSIECHPDYDVYQYCVVKVMPSPGLLSAVVDPSKRVIVLHAVTVVGLEGLHVEADSVRSSWSRVAEGQSVPPLVVIGDTGAVRWTSVDRRWTAEQHFNGRHDPDQATQVILVDTKGVEQLVAKSGKAADDAKRSGWIAPTAEDAAAAMEERKANRKSDYGALATTLSQLGDFETAHWNEHRTYTDNVGALPGIFISAGTILEIVTATDSGWTAKASNPDFPGLSCVAAGGRVPAIDLPATVGGRSISSASGVACDPLPPGQVSWAARAGSG